MKKFYVIPECVLTQILNDIVLASGESYDNFGDDNDFI